LQPANGTVEDYTQTGDVRVCTRDTYFIPYGGEKDAAQICNENFGEEANCEAISPLAINTGGCAMKRALQQVDCFTKLLGGYTDISCCYDREISFNWRTFDGRNWMSPVRDQGNCGSCVAFAAVGVIEAKNNLNNTNPDLDIDLSEQELVSECSSSIINCDGGGQPDQAIDYVLSNGLRTEECFPYLGIDAGCTPRCDVRHAIASKYYVEINDDIIKRKLVDSGPIVVTVKWSEIAFDKDMVGRFVIDDAEELYHSVVLVGYNEVGGIWMFKNSWGTWWGDNGYGKFAYDGCTFYNALGVE